MLKERFGAKDPRSCWFRAAVQTSALRLTAQQPLNNIARATIQTLAATLAGVQSIHTTSFDEAYALPTEESHKLSIRLQQVIACETNVTKTADPLGGAFAIEWLTDKLEEEIESLMRLIEDNGGLIECYQRGWVEEQVNEARYEYSRSIENGQQLVVGVNAYREEEETEPKIELFKQARNMQERRKRYIKRYREKREGGKVDKALGSLYKKARDSERPNLFTPVLEAVEARATTGEIVDTLRKAENFTIRL
jgi:methylmalonyl-CoA mutase N-terminal domain/subunit